jgi:hypothetical protein
MKETETVSETFNSNSSFTLSIAWQDFIIFSHCESLDSSMDYNRLPVVSSVMLESGT